MLYDVIVVGSGPAGAIAAARLAEKKKKVLLLDQETFPRDKVCGDGMPIEVMRFLADIGIDIQAEALPHKRIEKLYLGASSGTALSLKESSRTQYSLVAKRYHFDAMLHNFACRKGAHFEQKRIDGFLLNEQGQYRGVKAKDGTEFEARYVIAADGVGSRLNRNHNFSQSGEKTISIRAYGKTQKKLEPQVNFYFYREYLPGYAWIFPVGDNEVNVGVYLDKASYQQKQENLNQLLDSFLELMRDKFEIELMPETVKTWSLPIFTQMSPRHEKNSLYIGDAGYFVNALTGGGIYHALKTGFYSAEAIISGQVEDFDATWGKEIATTLKKSFWIQSHLASSAFLFESVLRLGQVPLIRRPILKAIAGDHF